MEVKQSSTKMKQEIEKALELKNVIFTFYIRDSSFLTTKTATRDVLQKFDKVAKFLGKAENKLRGKFFLPPIQFKTRLCHAHIIVF